MSIHGVELGLYQDQLFDISKRIDVIADHINHVKSEGYLIVEIETVCLQFRKILESIALLSLIANKTLYAEQHEKFAKHYNARLIMQDLERINPNFYPQPIKRIENKNGMDRIENITEGYLEKDEFLSIYEKCGGMMHAHNPFSSRKTKQDYEELEEAFPAWLTKIHMLIAHHEITLQGCDLKVVGLLKTSQTGFPQAVIFEKVGSSSGELEINNSFVEFPIT